jgi:site-specific DNA-cytosine methylase
MMQAPKKGPSILQQHSSAFQVYQIPVIILYGGYGGVTEGLLSTGKFEILGVFEFDQHTVELHQKQFPQIPIFRYTLGRSKSKFLQFVDRNVVRKEVWKQLYIHSSPPCQQLSTTNSNQNVDQGMKEVVWNIDLFAMIEPACFTIENVQAMGRCLRTSHPQLFNVDLNANLVSNTPQSRVRTIVSNWILKIKTVDQQFDYR